MSSHSPHDGSNYGARNNAPTSATPGSPSRRQDQLPPNHILSQGQHPSHRPSRLPIRTGHEQPPSPQRPSRAQQRDDDFAEDLAVGSTILGPDYGPSGRPWPTSMSHELPPPRTPPSDPPPKRPPQRPRRPPEDSSRTDDQPRPASYAETAIPQYPPPSQKHDGPRHYLGSNHFSNPSADHLPWMHQPPLPQIPQHVAHNRVNQRAPLGPPPSSRRGPAHYYAPIAGVHPIEEEEESKRSSTGTHASATAGGDLARKSSSAVPSGPALTIPTALKRASQHDASSSVYDDDESARGSAANSRRTTFAPPKEPSIEEPAGPVSPGLARQASIGRKSKPKLTTVTVGDKSKKEGSSSHPQTPLETSAAGGPPRGRGLDDESRHLHTLGSTSSPRAGESPRRSDLDLSSEDGSDMEKRAPEMLRPPPLFTEVHGSPRLQAKARLDAPPQSQAARPVKGKSPNRLSTRQSPDVEALKTPTPGLSERNGKHRPTHLAVDATRSHDDTRGSLTSLSDLIMRATRLASNLDRGKTASRLGVMNWMEAAPKERERRFEENQKHNTQSTGGTSDMIAAFPSPQIVPPQGYPRRSVVRSSFGNWSDRHSRAYWPRGRNNSRAGTHDDEKLTSQSRRKCCGVPLWLFLLLLIILILLVAAAIIIPIALIVVPQQNRSNSSPTINQCTDPITCENGGANIASANGTCQCICVNGFTGSRCTVASSTGCATLSVASQANNATVGDQIPTIIANSNPLFGIPLSEQILLGAFSSVDLSCASENALITFTNTNQTFLDGGSSVRRRDADDELAVDAFEGGFRAEDALLMPRQDSSPSTTSASPSSTGASGTTTSAGIVFQSGPSPTVPSGSSSTSSTTSSSSSPPGSSTTGTSASSNSSSATTPSGPTATLSFARVAILYILQSTSSLSAASSAQLSLQSYFSAGETTPDSQTGQSSAANASSLSLGSGWTCDLNRFLLRDGSGVVHGGNGTVAGG